MLSRVTSLCDKTAAMLTVLDKSSRVARRAGEQGRKSIVCSKLFWSWQPKVLITSQMDEDSGLKWRRGKSGAQSIYS